ncbi:hypothetical protein G7Y89_g5952 [Cudoniella acicularis]|uniref:Uncharacterized protein n=1 Tax=Cudoniella acicularis TaxID=354080 RepID=A0A8H4RLF9_9HELO|nr:hypothetical protein G7Y89_g5952 [Cudoniella acicularis]
MPKDALWLQVLHKLNNGLLVTTSNPHLAGFKLKSCKLAPIAESNFNDVEDKQIENLRAEVQTQKELVGGRDQHARELKNAIATLRSQVDIQARQNQELLEQVETKQYQLREKDREIQRVTVEIDALRDVERLRSLPENVNDIQIQAVKDTIPNQPSSDQDSTRQAAIVEAKTQRLQSEIKTLQSQCEQTPGGV